MIKEYHLTVNCFYTHIHRIYTYVRAFSASTIENLGMGPGNEAIYTHIYSFSSLQLILRWLRLCIAHVKYMYVHVYTCTYMYMHM